MVNITVDCRGATPARCLCEHWQHVIWKESIGWFQRLSVRDVAAIQFINYWVVWLWQSNVSVLYTFPFVLSSCALVSWLCSWSVVIFCNAFNIFHWWFCFFNIVLFPNNTPWRIAINCCLKERNVFYIATNLLSILSFHHHFLHTFRAVSLLT